MRLCDIHVAGIADIGLFYRQMPLISCHFNLSRFSSISDLVFFIRLFIRFFVGGGASSS